MTLPTVLAEIAAGVSSLWEERAEVERALTRIEASPSPRETAFEVAVRHSALRAMGPLVMGAAPRGAEIIDAVRTSAEHAAWLTSITARIRESRALLGALRAVFPGSFTHEDSPKAREHRERLRKKPAEPLWGSEDHPVSIQQLWVTPRFAYRVRAQHTRVDLGGSLGLGDAPTSEPPTIEGDDAVAKVVSLIEANDAPFIGVLGAAGAGKSALLGIVAAELAARDTLFPVLIRLRDVEAGRGLGAEIERLVTEALTPEVLAQRDDLVLLLDGFDEVPGERIGLAGSAIHHARDWVVSGRARAVVVAGRDVMVGLNDEVMPVGAHVLKLLPLSKRQVRAWSARWRKATGATFEGSALLTNPEGGAAAFEDLARVPLLLYLLATMALHGVDVSPGQGMAHTARVYHRLVRWYCQRQEERADGKGFKATRLQGLLRLAGFVAMVRGGAIVDLADLQRVVRQSAPTQAEDLARFETEQTLLAFSFRHGDALRWEFSHRSLAEFLAAEFLASTCRQISEEYTDEFGETRYRLDDAQAVRIWIERLSLTLLPMKVEHFLLPMLVDPEAFREDRPVDPSRDQLPRLRVALGRVYRGLLDEMEIEAAVAASRQWGVPLWKMRGVGFANLFTLAGASVSLLSDWGVGCTEDRFAPERVAPCRVLEAITALNTLPEASLDLYPRTLGRLWMDGVSSTYISSLSSDIATETTPHQLFFTSFADCDLSDAYFSGYGLAQTIFRGATLSGVFFDMCNLFGSDFRKAKLDETLFARSDLSLARFTPDQTPQIVTLGALDRKSVTPRRRGKWTFKSRFFLWRPPKP